MARFQQHSFERQIHEMLQNRLNDFGKYMDDELLKMSIKIAEDPRVKNSQMRFRWDLFYRCPYAHRHPIMEALYAAGFKDPHVDRSLHRFCKTLNLPFYPQEYNGR